MEPNKVSVIVFLLEDDAESVFLVPTQDVGYDQLEQLRRRVRANGVDVLRIQRLPYDGVAPITLHTFDHLNRHVDTLIQERV